MASYDDKIVTGEQLETILTSVLANNQKMTVDDINNFHSERDNKTVKIGFFGSFDTEEVDSNGVPISQNYNDTTGPAVTVTVPIDGIVEIPSELIRFGYSIGSWNTKNGGSGTKLSNGVAFLARTIAEKGIYHETFGCYKAYGIFSQKKYTIVYDTQGGSSMGAKTNVTTGMNNLVKSKRPAKNGYVFGSYNTKPDGTGLEITDSVTLAQLLCSSTSINGPTVTIYAQWTEATND